MKGTRLFLTLLSLIVLSACANMRVAQDVSLGRQAYLVGNHETALGYFQRAAAADPAYVYGTALRQGVLSYLGRSEYSIGRLPEARQTLERALAANKDEDVARLYLGLALARSGDQQRGLRDIESGMKGIHAFLEYVNEAHRFSFGQFWDPNLELRKAIKTNLAMISGKDVDWQKLITNSEWIARRIEEEIDKASADESRHWNRESDSSGDGQP